MLKSSYLKGLLFSFLVVPLYSFAQNPSNYYEEEPKTFLAGLVLGGNFTQVDGDNYAGYRKAGLNAGGIVFTRFGQRAAVGLEILYVQKGSRSNGVSTNYDRTVTISDYSINLNYAEIPLQIYYFDKRKSNIGFGVAYSRLISSKEDITSKPQISQDTINSYPFKKSDVSMILGGNILLYKGLFLNLRFQYSLVPIRKNKDIFPDLAAGGRDQFSNVVTVRFMYLF